MPAATVLASLRLAAALSQRELAKKAGVSYVTVARLEGGRNAHPRTIRKLAAALKVSPGELMHNGDVSRDVSRTTITGA
jgi:transcriptional regulator with XRE-family HTH domain